jgi:hypothetical protein
MSGVGPGGLGGADRPGADDLGERSVASRAPAEAAAAEGSAAERMPSERPPRAETILPEVESPHLPGVLGSTEQPAVQGAGLDVPTGPMERFVRPSDRDAARAAARHADAEANAMERVMRDSPRPSPAGSGERRVADPGVATPGLDPEPPGEAGFRGGRGESSAAGKAGAVLSGLIRPRRQPPQQGVYDAEQDD